MNANIELQKRLKAKYGVTFTPNMNVKGFSEAWDRVPSSVKSTLPPEIGIGITLALTAYNLAVDSRTIYVPLKQTYDQAIILLDKATSVVYDGGASLAAYTAMELPKAKEQLEDLAVQQASNTLFSLLSSVG